MAVSGLDGVIKSPRITLFRWSYWSIQVDAARPPPSPIQPAAGRLPRAVAAEILGRTMDQERDTLPPEGLDAASEAPSEAHRRSTRRLMVGSGEIREAADERESLGDHALRQAVRARLFGAAPDPARIGRFILIRRIGVGGMGVVYSAYDEELDRKVAIKVLLAERQTREGRARILREAQALARISHPNIVHVYEVGEWQGQVFMAMEFVEGQTLDAWVRRGERTWREILAAYRQAGQGLAAAHEAGLVHRDIKPENIVIDARARVLILDFGLARLDDTRGEEATTPGEGATATEGSDLRAVEAITRTVTRSGVVMGTPAYMPPELSRGAQADARSDQFSFCVALYEALHGERPFPGRDLPTIVAAILTGKLREPPRGSKVPMWLRRVLLRGLAARPEDRWPSMQALLTALARDPARHSRPLLAGVTIALSLGIGAVGIVQPWESGGICEGAEARLIDVWDDAQRAAVQTAITGTGVAYAAETWTLAERRLDDYAREWAAMYRAGCRSHQRGEHSSDLYDRQVACLEGRLAELDDVARLLAGADAVMIPRIGEMLGALGPISTCGDTTALRERYAPPPDARAAAATQAIRRQLIELRTKVDAGQIEEALEATKGVVRTARQVGYRPVLAEALFELGHIYYLIQRWDDAEATIQESFLTADAARHDEMAARAGARLVFLVGYDRGRHTEGLIRAQHVQAVLERLGPGHVAEAELDNSLGAIHLAMGKIKEARSYYEHGLAVAAAITGPRAPSVRNFLLLNLGEVCEVQGDIACMEENVQRALELAETTFGADHPKIGYFLHLMAKVRVGQRRWGEAEALVTRAVEAARRNFGDGHPRLRHNLMMAGEILLSAGRLDHARALLEEGLDQPGDDSADRMWLEILRGEIHHLEGDDETALAAFERGVASQRAHRFEGSWSGRSALVLYAELLVDLGRYREAAAESESLIAELERLYGPDHVDLGQPLTTLARARIGLGDLDGADEALNRATRTIEALSDEHWYLAGPMQARAELELARGAPRAAAEAAERGLRLLTRYGARPVKRAELGLLLARAYDASGGPCGRAETAARRALADAQVLTGSPVIRAKIEAWLAKH
ncbi:MAG: serine/threonine-protein kinase [Nannocystaceae bacterium]